MKTHTGRRRKLTLELIDRKTQGRGTRRGFGTGIGKRKGSKNYPSTRVREVLASAEASLKSGMPTPEVMRRLMCVALTEPSIFKRALALAPRQGGRSVKGFGPIVFEAFTPGILAEPPMAEVAKHVGLSIDVLKGLERHRPNQYAKFAFDLIATRLTPGEFALLKALQYARVREMSDRLFGYDVQQTYDPPSVSPLEAKWSYTAQPVPPKPSRTLNPPVAQAPKREPEPFEIELV